MVAAGDVLSSFFLAATAAAPPGEWSRFEVADLFVLAELVDPASDSLALVLASFSFFFSASFMSRIALSPADSVGGLVPLANLRLLAAVGVKVALPGRLFPWSLTLGILGSPLPAGGAGLGGASLLNCCCCGCCLGGWCCCCCCCCPVVGGCGGVGAPCCLFLARSILAMRSALDRFLSSAVKPLAPGSKPRDPGLAVVCEDFAVSYAEARVFWLSGVLKLPAEAFPPAGWLGGGGLGFPSPPCSFSCSDTPSTPPRSAPFSPFFLAKRRRSPYGVRTAPRSLAAASHAGDACKGKVLEFLAAWD